MGKVLKGAVIHRGEKTYSQGDTFGDNFRLSTRRGRGGRYSSIHQQDTHSLSPEGVVVCGL